MKYLNKIFTEQKELIKKYHKIEKQNGFYIAKFPKDFNTHLGQARLRDLTFRFIEELFEALLNIYKTDKISAEFFEEISDALHFLTELSIEIGITEKEISQFNLKNNKLTNFDFKALINCLVEIFVSVQISLNYLKNKPWKQKIIETDFEKYKNSILLIWTTFFDFLNKLGFQDFKDIYNLYHRKFKKNLSRINNGY